MLLWTVLSLSFIAPAHVFTTAIDTKRFKFCQESIQELANVTFNTYLHDSLKIHISLFRLMNVKQKDFYVNSSGTPYWFDRFHRLI